MKGYSVASSSVSFVILLFGSSFVPKLRGAVNAGIFESPIPRMKLSRYTPSANPLSIVRQRSFYPPMAFIRASSVQRCLPFSDHIPTRAIMERTSVVPVKGMVKFSPVVESSRLYHSSPQRNFFSNQNKPNDDDKSFLGQVKSVAKKFLPASWFQSEEEKRQKSEMKRVEKEIKSEIQQVFKDFPLPIRMMGNMIAPIFGGLMSSLAETAASQQTMVDVVYDQAVRSIQSNAYVRQELGDTITVGRPFSQSSSTSSINGVTTSHVELAFAVSGSRGEGVGRLQASGSGTKNPTIQFLEVQANGRRIDVNTISSASPRTGQFSSGYNGDDNIIDAEIIEEVKK